MSRGRKQSGQIFRFFTKLNERSQTPSLSATNDNQLTIFSNDRSTYNVATNNNNHETAANQSSEKPATAVEPGEKWVIN